MKIMNLRLKMENVISIYLEEELVIKIKIKASLRLILNMKKLTLKSLTMLRMASRKNYFTVVISF